MRKTLGDWHTMAAASEAFSFVILLEMPRQKILVIELSASAQVRFGVLVSVLTWD